MASTKKSLKGSGSRPKSTKSEMKQVNARHGYRLSNSSAQLTSEDTRRAVLDKRSATQREWYQRNKQTERAKARERVARNRAIQLFRPSSDDGYDLDDTPTTSHSMASDSPTISLDHAELSPLYEHDTVIGDFQQWDRWSSAERMAGLSRWFLYADDQYGSLDRWAAQFMADWEVNRSAGPAVDELLARARKMIQAGYHAMSYLGRLMEGTMPEDISLWCDLYMKSHQYTRQLSAAVIGLRCRLDQVTEN